MRRLRGNFQKKIITIFVIVWLFIFTYETTRYFYLNPFFGVTLPKLKFLFPPAGWIMFYRVDESYQTTDVYGHREGRWQRIDPHDVFTAKAVLYDNIHRNVLSTVLYPQHRDNFCRYLRRKFPQYDFFSMVLAYYPSVLDKRKKYYRVVYRC